MTIPCAVLTRGGAGQQSLVAARTRPDREPAAAAKHVQEGRIDLAVLCLPGEEGPFEVCELLRVSWVLLVRADTEFGRGSEPPTPAEVARVTPLIGAKTERLSSSVEARLRSEAGPPRIVFRSDLAETAQALAGAGVGAALVPSLAVDGRDPRVRIVELGSLVPPLSVGLAWHRNRRLPDAVEEFREVLRQVCSCAGARALQSRRPRGNRRPLTAAREQRDRVHRSFTGWIASSAG